MKYLAILTTTAAAVFFAATTSYAAPLSTWYISAPAQQQLVRFGGGFDTPSEGVTSHAGNGTNRDYAIAVGDTVRTVGSRSGGIGLELNLDGTPTGTTYAWPGGNTGFLLDGTTDGSSNYAIGNIGGVGTVHRYDTDWTNGVTLFDIGSSSGTGITYDPVSDTFWISGSTDLMNFDRNGNLLSSFATGLFNLRSLGMDYADGTLWVAHFHPHPLLNQLRTASQFSTSGTILSSNVSFFYPIDPRGGEFQFVAAEISTPSSLPLFAWTVGALVLQLLRRRRWGRSGS